MELPAQREQPAETSQPLQAPARPASRFPPAVSRSRWGALRRRVKEARRRAGMIHPIFIRRLYSCTARARGVRYRAPQGPTRPGRRGERAARHARGTPTTQAQHAARTLACSHPAAPSCQPRERPRLPPPPPWALPAFSRSVQRPCCRVLQPRGGSAPCRAAAWG